MWKQIIFYLCDATYFFRVNVCRPKPIMMKKSDRLIFVTNDDGYDAPGFAAAIEVARTFGRVVAVAPDTPQSGRSQAITIYDPLFLKHRCHDQDLDIYSLSGTPVDCVKFAFDHLIADERVDLVISGINHGSNSAINVLYSGTMGAAIEGSFYGCPSVGLSLLDHSRDADFTNAKQYGRQIIASILESDDCPLPLCLNVNVPAQPDIKGVRVSRQCRGIWREDFFPHTDPNGRNYFWLTGSYTNYEPAAEDTDEWALSNGYVSVVPIQIDLTAYNDMVYLNKILK
jgi:5'-nucleotidase